MVCQGFCFCMDYAYVNACFQVVEETWVRKRREEDGYTLYAGLLGTAFLLFKAYQVTDDRNDLSLCAEIIKACDSASTDSP